MVTEWHPKEDLDSFGIGESHLPKRATRVAEAIRNELSILLIRHVRDPHLSDLTISRVELSDDLRQAKVYFTIFGKDHASATVKKSLVRAKGFMRSHLAKTLNMRFTPDLHFWYDETVAKVEKMERILDELARERDEHDKNS